MAERPMNAEKYRGGKPPADRSGTFVSERLLMVRVVERAWDESRGVILTQRRRERRVKTKAILCVLCASA